MKKLETARTTLAETQQKITELVGKRRQRLVAGDPAGAIAKIDDEIASLRHAAQTETDRIVLLEEEARRAEVEAVAKRRAGLITRFTKKLEAADAVAAELEASIAKSTELFHRVIALREEARAALPASNSHIEAASSTIEGAALSGNAVRGLLAYEFYRVSARPLKGGIPGERTVPSLPGSVCPRIDWQLQPEKIMPFAAALRQASAFAVSLMKDEVDPQALVPAAEASAPVPAQPTTAETKLAHLLQQQMKLAADPSREAEYMALVELIAKASDEANAAKGAAA